MFLYELALELDEKSGDLVEFAAGIGIEGLTAPTTLTREQVAAIRAAKAGQPLPPTSYGGTDDGRSPVAWAPPGSVPPPGMPQFESPGAGSGAPGGPGATPGWPMVGDDDEPRTSRASMAIVAVAVVLAVSLFGYMATNGGPDKAKEQKLAAANARDDSRPAPTIAPIPTTTTTTTTAAPSDDGCGCGSSGPSLRPVDVARFCSAARKMAAYELRIAASEIEVNWERVRRDVQEGRTDWESAVNEMIAATDGQLKADLLTYQSSYRPMLDKMAQSASRQGMVDALKAMDLPALFSAARSLSGSIASDC